MGWRDLLRAVAGEGGDCSDCGRVDGAHNPGCPRLTSGGAPQRGKVKGTDGKPHRHNYITIRREQHVIKDRRRRYRITYYIQECANPGCPRPDNIEIERVQL